MNKMKNIRIKNVNLVGCKEKLVIQKAIDWFSDYSNINPPVFSTDIVVAKYIEYFDKTIEARTTVAIFRRLEDAKLFFKHYNFK